MGMFRTWLHRGKDEQGFTLVELLMVMVIIGVLAGIGFAGMGMLQKRTLSTKADTYWRVLDSAARMYVISGGNPTDAIVTSGSGNDTSTVVADIKTLLSDYLDANEEPWGKAEPVKLGTATVGCMPPADTEEPGTYYCILPVIADEGNGGKYKFESDETKATDIAVSIWVADGKRVGAASNNNAPVGTDSE